MAPATQPLTRRDAPAVVCFGLALWDALADAVGLPPAQVGRWTPYAGGAGLNVACGLGALGVSSALIAAIGQDSWGEQLLQVLQRHQVCTDYVQQYPYPTRVVAVTRNLAGEREFAGFLPPDGLDFADAHVTFVEPHFTPQWVYIEALMLAFPTARTTCWQLLAWASAHGIKTLVDVNWRPIFWADERLAQALTRALLQQATAVKLTSEEAQWLFGTCDVEHVHQQCPQVTYILVTQGAQGCTYRMAEHRGYCPAFAVNTVDTTGAGDAFVAGWLQQWVTHGETLMGDAQRLHQAIRWASAVAALSTTAPGAITYAPTVAAVQAFLDAPAEPAAAPPRLKG